MTTFDIDALVKVDEANADRLLAALTDLDARYRERDRVIRPDRADILAGGHLLLMTNSGPLDVLGHIAQEKRYEDVVSSTLTIDVGGLSIRVLSLEALLEDKKSLGRDKDLAALRLLEKVLLRRR